jgi:ATP-binding cassette subfamily B protein
LAHNSLFPRSRRRHLARAGPAYAANARRVGEDIGAITVLVSHRFSTVRMADIILVVADGRIAEAGSHGDLMIADGLYAELFALQASAYR